MGHSLAVKTTVLFTIVSLMWNVVVNAQNISTQSSPVQINSIDWRSDGKIAISYKDGTLEIRDANYHIISTFPNISAQVIAWNPSLVTNQIAAVVEGYNGGAAILILNSKTGTIVQTLSTESIYTDRISWSSDGSEIVAPVNGGIGPLDHRYIMVWNTKTGVASGPYLESRI